jgi:hypothetical protein
MPTANVLVDAWMVRLSLAVSAGIAQMDLDAIGIPANCRDANQTPIHQAQGNA